MLVLDVSDRTEKIRLKSFVEFYWKENTIFLLARPGQAISLKDPEKFIFTVCSLIQSPIELLELKIEINKTHPAYVEYINQLLNVLDKELLIELMESSSRFEPEYLEQNSRNIEFIGSFLNSSEDKLEEQGKLQKLKVAILGTGGVGSNVLMALCGMGVTTFNIIDHDTVNLSNFNRQLAFNADDIGNSKVACLEANLRKKFPRVDISSRNKKIESIEDIYRTIDGCDFVFACADEPREQIINWVNKACIEAKIPFMCGGVDSRWATVFTIWPGKTGCVECWKNNAQSSAVLYQNISSNPDYRSAVQPNVASIPVINVLVGLMAGEFLKVSTNICEAQSLGNLIGFDFPSMKIDVKESWEKSESCSVCGMQQYSP